MQPKNLLTIYKNVVESYSVMKSNTEAWQLGDEDGFSDGSVGSVKKQSFSFPKDWTDGEKRNYEIGYNDGYESGLRMYRND